MKGVIRACVSAGSKQVGANETWSAKIIGPWGVPAKANPATALLPKAAGAGRSGGAHGVFAPEAARVCGGPAPLGRACSSEGRSHDSAVGQGAGQAGGARALTEGDRGRCPWLRGR